MVAQNVLKSGQNIITRKIHLKIPTFNQDPNVFIRSNTISYRFVDFDTGVVIDTTKCHESEANNLVYSLQLNKDDKYKINIPLYRSVKSNSLDGYNSTSQAFTSRCYNRIDPLMNADTTLNYRRQHYFQNLTVLCNDGECEYKGLNDNFFVNCECKKPQETLYFTFVNQTLPSLRTINLDVVTCPHVAFVAVNKNFNLGIN